MTSTREAAGRPDDRPVLAQHTSLPLAGYAYSVTDDRWEWDDAMYALHGLSRGQVVPTTELMLAHKHRDDRESAHAVFVEAITHGTPFACRHRIIDAHRATHAVIAFGYAESGDTGDTVAVRGYIAEVTDTLVAETRAAADYAVGQVTGSRSTIDQAKGMLMGSYGLCADEAFGVLQTVASPRNIRVRDLAATVVEHQTRHPTHPGGARAAIAHLIAMATGVRLSPGPAEG